jgi:hypothetical protein
MKTKHLTDNKQNKQQHRQPDALVCAESTKKQILQNVKQAVKEINLIKKGTLKARDARELLNEL